MDTPKKKAFVLMPFHNPYNSYYPAVFKPALEAAGYDVTRADDLFTPNPIMLDIQRSILEAHLILCEMSEKNPNVFYELGLAHAVGRPAILVSRKEEDIPFDLRHVRIILYEPSVAGWEEKLRKSITAAAKSVEGNEEIWPPPLINQNPVSSTQFSKEDFAELLNSVKELARLTTQEKLKSIPVIEKMVPRAMMYFEVLMAANPAGQMKIVDMIDRQEKAFKGLRIPLLDENYFPLYIIHRSTIDRYLTARTLGGADPKTIVLQELLDDPDYMKILDESFSVVPREATLADVKNELELSPYAQDVFVTEKGTKIESILGFITNTMVEEYSTV